MRTLINRKRMGHSIGFLTATTVLFGAAWTTWSPSPGSSCVQPDLTNTQIRECVAKQARHTEPDAATFALLLVGGASLTASLVTGIRSFRRVMAIADAAEEIGVPPGEVRLLLDRGSLEIYEREEGAIYLNPDDVRRLSSHRRTRDQPSHA